MRPIASLLSGTALLLLGVGLLNTLIPLRGDMYGYSHTLLGGLTSAYYAGYLVGTFAIPPLVRRIGYIRTFAFCTACVACVVLLHALSHNPLLWLLLRFLAGVALVGLYMLIESWLNASAQPAQRGSVFAAYMVVNLGSLALAQQLLHIDGQPFVLFIVVALLICAATLPVVATRLAQPVLQPTPRLRLTRLFAAAPSAGAGALLSGLAMGAFWGLLPVYVKDTGFNAAQVGTYMSVAIVGGALLQWPVGRLSDHHDRRIALALVSAAAGALAIVAPFLAGMQVASLVMIFLYGGMAFAAYPIVVAHLVDHLPPEDLMAASSSVLLIYGIGSALGPLIAGVLMTSLGPWSLFGWFALTQGATAAYAGYRYQTFQRTLSDEAHFRPMLRTTPSALELMPETDGPDATDTPSR
ncbi:MAG: MFS transporter [Rhodanobacter sp.]